MSSTALPSASEEYSVLMSTWVVCRAACSVMLSVGWKICEHVSSSLGDACSLYLELEGVPEFACMGAGDRWSIHGKAAIQSF